MRRPGFGDIALILSVLGDMRANVPDREFTVMTYGLNSPVFMSGLPFVGPAFDMGIQYISSKYSFNISHAYLTSPTARNCFDLSDDVMEIIARFYYRRYQREKPMFFVLAGKN